MCDPLSLSASIIAVAGCAATVCQGIIQIFSRFYQGPEELQRHITALLGLQSTFASIASLEHDDITSALLTPEFSARLQACMADLIAMEALAQSVFTKLKDGRIRRKWYRVRWSLGEQKEALKSHLNRIEAYHRTFSLELLLLGIRMNSQMLKTHPGQKDQHDPLELNITHNDHGTYSQVPNSFSLSENNILCKSIWKSVQNSLLRLSICFGPIYTKQQKPCLRAEAANLQRKKGSGVLLSAIWRHITPLRLDLIIFYLNNQNGCSFNFSLHCNLFFPHVVPYHARIFSLVELGDIEGTKEEILKGHGSLFDVLLSGDTLLHVATSKGHYDMVSFLLQNGALVDVCNNYGETPFHRAVAVSKSYDVCRLLLQYGSGLLSCNTDGQTALHTFATPITKQIILYNSSEIDFLALDNLGMTLLHYLAWSSKTTPEDFQCYHREIRFLQDTDDGSSYSLLHLAAQRGNFALVKYLISFLELNNAQAWKPDQHGRTIVHYAVESKRAIETLSVLPSRLINTTIHTRDDMGRSPLHHALFHGNVAAVQALLSVSPDSIEELEVTDNSGLNPLGIAIEIKNKVLESSLEDQAWVVVNPVPRTFRTQSCDANAVTKCWKQLHLRRKIKSGKGSMRMLRDVQWGFRTMIAMVICLAVTILLFCYYSSISSRRR